MSTRFYRRYSVLAHAPCRDSLSPPPRIATIAFVMLLVGEAAMAVAPATLQVSQVVTQGPSLVAYVAVRDEAGAAVSGIEPGQIHATVGPEVAEVVAFRPFSETGEGVTYFVLVDVSQSIVGSRFQQMQKSLRDWIAALAPADQAAVLEFGSEVRTLVAPTANRAALADAIDALAPAAERTQLHMALLRALDLSRQEVEGLPPRRAIVVLSDGLNDAPGGPSGGDVLAGMADGAAPIYGIGFSGIRDRSRREAGLAALGGFVRRSGGVLVDAGGGDPATALEAMRLRIQEVYRADLLCNACARDGNRYRVQIALSSDGLKLSDGYDVRLYPISAPREERDVQPNTDSAEASLPPEDDTRAGTANEAERSRSDPVEHGSNEPLTVLGSDASPADPTATSSVSETENPIPPDSGRPIWQIYAAAAAVGSTFLALVWALLRGRRKPAVSSALESAQEVNIATTDFEPQITLPSEPSHEAARHTQVVHLVFMRGTRRGHEVELPLPPSAVLGRDGDCTLALPEDDSVSSRHARLVIDGKQVLLEDLGSTNHTYLNGVSIHAPHPLENGDVVRVGQTEFRVQLQPHADD